MAVTFSEQDIAAHAAEWLAASGYDVYEEVHTFTGRADLVGVAGKKIAIVEVKKSFSLDLLYQCIAGQRVAGVVWACAYAKKHAPYDFIALARMLGVGVLWFDGESIRQSFDPEYRRAPHRDWLIKSWGSQRPPEQCRRGGEYARAGSARGGHWTPYKQTCADLLRHVRANPGCLLGDALKSLKTHYSSEVSARQTLAFRLTNGQVPGIVVERDGRRLRLFAESEKREKT